MGFEPSTRFSNTTFCGGRRIYEQGPERMPTSSRRQAQTRQECGEDLIDTFGSGLFIGAHHDLRIVGGFVGRVDSGKAF